MNELKTTESPKHEGVNSEMAALSGLLSITNAIPRESPKVGNATPVVIIEDDPVMPETSPAPIVEPEAQLPAFVIPPVTQIRTAGGNKLFFTGRICAGKDYAATQANRSIIGLADPLYYLAEHFFGVKVDANTGKDLPGVRQFLQMVGQWGRMQVDVRYPLTTERAIFCTMIRSLASAGIITGYEVEWKDFGKDTDIWLSAAIKRSSGVLNAAITNVRFENEFKRMKSEGWQHFHVMTNPGTWTRRLAEKKLTPQSPEVNDISEKLSASLDAGVQKKVSQQRSGPKLHVIWNDTSLPPSPRFYTLAEFLAEVNR